MAFAAWVAEQESARRSERIRAETARRKAARLPVASKPGATDKGKRKRSPYVAAWEPRRCPPRGAPDRRWGSGRGPPTIHSVAAGCGPSWACQPHNVRWRGMIPDK